MAGRIFKPKTEKWKAACVRHGYWNKPEYRVWAELIQRCRNPKSKQFKDYGGRGITVCDLWQKSFAAFIAEVGPRPSPTHTIDRRENNRGYEPGNVRWATRGEQIRNRRNTVLHNYRGRAMILLDISVECGINYFCLCGRIKRGWTIEEATAEPSRIARRA